MCALLDNHSREVDLFVAEINNIEFENYISNCALKYGVNINRSDASVSSTAAATESGTIDQTNKVSEPTTNQFAGIALNPMVITTLDDLLVMLELQQWATCVRHQLVLGFAARAVPKSLAKDILKNCPDHIRGQKHALVYNVAYWNTTAVQSGAQCAGKDGSQLTSARSETNAEYKILFPGSYSRLDLDTVMALVDEAPSMIQEGGSTAAATAGTGIAGASSAAVGAAGAKPKAKKRVFSEANAYSSVPGGFVPASELAVAATQSAATAAATAVEVPIRCNVSSAQRTASYLAVFVILSVTHQNTVMVDAVLCQCQGRPGDSPSAAAGAGEPPLVHVKHSTSLHAAPSPPVQQQEQVQEEQSGTRRSGDCPSSGSGPGPGSGPGYVALLRDCVERAEAWAAGLVRRPLSSSSLGFDLAQGQRELLLHDKRVGAFSLLAATPLDVSGSVTVFLVTSAPVVEELLPADTADSFIQVGQNSNTSGGKINEAINASLLQGCDFGSLSFTISNEALDAEMLVFSLNSFLFRNPCSPTAPSSLLPSVAASQVFARQVVQTVVKKAGALSVKATKNILEEALQVLHPMLYFLWLVTLAHESDQWTMRPVHFSVHSHKMNSTPIEAVEKLPVASKTNENTPLTVLEITYAVCDRNTNAGPAAGMDTGTAAAMAVSSSHSSSSCINPCVGYLQLSLPFATSAVSAFREKQLVVKDILAGGFSQLVQPADWYTNNGKVLLDIITQFATQKLSSK
jgi:hypothetical protein